MKKLNLSLATLVLLLSGTPAFATILWMGGEDIDFPNGAGITTSTVNTNFRSGYSRAGIQPAMAGAIAQSTPFPGGAVTSAWLSVRPIWSGCVNITGTPQLFGLSKSGTMNSLWIGTNMSSVDQLTLWKYDGTTWTQLAKEGGASFSHCGTPRKIDVQISNYGAAATVNVYLNGTTTPIITYNGDVTAGGNTSLDTVVFSSTTPAGAFFSEFIVSTSDTRLLSLATLAPNAAGTNNQWTGAYSAINPTTISDISYINDNTSGDQFECKMNSLPAGAFPVIGVKVAARGWYAAGGMTSLSVGIYSNATVNAPAATTMTTSQTTYETYYSSTNPTTSAAWTTTDINNLQVNLKSAP